MTDARLDDLDRLANGATKGRSTHTELPDMTEKRLAEIEERAKAARRGPYSLYSLPFQKVWITDERQTELAVASYERRDEFEFFAASRTDVPDLVAEVRRLRALLASLSGGVASMYGQVPAEESDAEFLAALSSPAAASTEEDAKP